MATAGYSVAFINGLDFQSSKVGGYCWH
jgi:hypothetical protein